MNWKKRIEGKLSDIALKEYKYLFGPTGDDQLNYCRQVSSQVDPKLLAERLTTEELIWLHGHSVEEAKKPLLQVICEKEDMSMDLFQKALKYALNRLSRLGEKLPLLALRNYALLRTLQNDYSDSFQQSLPLNGPSKHYSLEWATLNLDSVQARFSGYINGEKPKVYIDDPVSALILYKGVENALVSFWSESHNTLLINQIQGVRVEKDGRRLHSRGLARFDWQKALVRFAEEIGRIAGYDFIGIRSAANNHWCRGYWDSLREVWTDPHYSREFAEKRYDETAERLGYSLGKNGNWYKPLQKGLNTTSKEKSLHE